MWPWQSRSRSSVSSSEWRYFYCEILGATLSIADTSRLHLFHAPRSSKSAARSEDKVALLSSKGTLAAQCYTKARTKLACASVALSRCGLRCDVAKLASFDSAFFLVDRFLTLCCNTGTEHCFVHLYLIDDRPSCGAVACRSDVAFLTWALMHGREFACFFFKKRGSSDLGPVVL